MTMPAIVYIVEWLKLSYLIPRSYENILEDIIDEALRRLI